MSRQIALSPLPLMPLTGRPDPGAETLQRKLRRAALRSEPAALSVATRSPLSPRDLDLLVELDRRHSVTVDVEIPADADGARPLLKTVSRLAAEGIAARIVCPPAPQGTREGEETLRSLFAAAREAGAWDVAAEAAPKRFRFARLRRDRDRERLAMFRRLRLEYGFPRPLPGRG